MATKEEVGEKFVALRDSLQDLSGDSGFSNADRQAFMWLAVEVGGAAEMFDTYPKHGDEDPRYDPPLSAGAAAVAACRSARPGDQSSISRGKSAAHAAVAAVERATDRAQNLASSSAVQAGTLRGTLRVRRQPAPAPYSEGMRSIQSGEDEEPPHEPYVTSLVKLFPAEAVTLYPLAIGIAREDGSVRLALIGLIGVFIVVLRFFATQHPGTRRPDWAAIGVAVISYILYVASLLGFGRIVGDDDQTRQLAAFITIMWVAVVPYLLQRRGPVPEA